MVNFRNKIPNFEEVDPAEVADRQKARTNTYISLSVICIIKKISKAREGERES